MNQDEIKAYLTWLENTFGLDYKDDDIGSKVYLWGKCIAMWENDTIYRIAGGFQNSCVIMYKEWSGYDA
jgi:hypothetical protein